MIETPGRGTTRLALWAASATAVAAAVALTVAITTPPRSGPYCRGTCVSYPYTDAAAFVPRDYLWMYPAILATLAFVVLAASIHTWAPPPRRPYSRTGLSLAVIGAGALLIDYAIQLTVMQPALLAGQTEGLSPLSQYNPHGVFIALENTGYAALAVAYLFLGAALTAARPRPAHAGGWVLIAAGALTLAALVIYAAVYRSRLDYRFEVAAILLTWLGQITAGVLLTAAIARNPVTRGARPASS